MRTTTRLALALTLIASVLFATIASTTAAADTEGTPLDELALVVVGDGSTTGNNTVPVALRLIDGAGDPSGAEVAFPTTAQGQNQPFTLAFNATQQGALQQSPDHEYVTVAGYAAPTGIGSINGTPTITPPDEGGYARSVGLVDAAGAVDTSTTLAGAYSRRHVRGAVTSNGTDIWTGGHGGGNNGIDAPNPGAVHHVPRGTDAPTAIADGPQEYQHNGRVVAIHDGQLYVTGDRPGYAGLLRVGEGVPTSAGASLELVAAQPSGHDVAHDFVFVGDDQLYVTYTEGATPGLAKYMNTAGTWEHVGSHAGTFWGVTGRVAGDDVVLYAVKGGGANNEVVRILDTGGTQGITADEVPITTAGSGYAFRGIDFAPGYEPGSDPVDPLPTVDWDVRIAGGSGNALGAVHGADSNPVATGTIVDPEGEDFTVTATSDDPTVLKDDDITVDVAADGTFTLSAASSAPGKAVITLTVETEDERLVASTLHYWVSEELPDPRALAHHGMSDASAAYDAGGGYRFVADDDSNQIRLFASGFGEAVAEFDFSGDVTAIQPGQTWDLEGAARIDDTIYWNGSFGNTRSGNIRLDRDIVLATTVVGEGADARLEFAGYTRGVRQALVDWDRADGHGQGSDAFGFHAATQEGASAEGPNSLNVEGAAIAPDDTTLWLGFRSPNTPLPAGDQALIVEVENIADVVGGAEPQIGEFIELDLGGRAIRDLKRTQDDDYLIIAGSADDAGEFAIFGWDGDPANEPVIAEELPALAGWAGSYEASGDVPSLADGTEIWLIQDVGTLDLYGDGSEAQDLPAAEFRKFPSHPFTLSFDGEFGVIDDDDDSDGGPTLTLSADSVTAGGQLEASGEGFGADDEITLELHSDPVHLATATADDQGNFTVSLTIPAETSAGGHTVVATADSGTAEASLTVTAGTTTAGSLPRTGALIGFWVLLLALLAVAAGNASLQAARRY